MEADIFKEKSLREGESATNHDRQRMEYFSTSGAEGRDTDEEAGHVKVDRRGSPSRLAVGLFFLCWALILFSVSTSDSVSAVVGHICGRSVSEERHGAVAKRDVSDQKILHVFQVAPPVLSPKEGPLSGMAPPMALPMPYSRSLAGQDDNNAAARSGDKKFLPPFPPCVVTLPLMQHVFGYSYGKPYVGQYMPPNCPFNRVIMNMTVSSKGRQFDRLAIMYFGDTEIYRTSTAEPTSDGIYWTYTKDMTHYLSLFQEPQKIIFDLGNLVNEIYNGSFNVTLTATFFTSAEAVSPADLIIPISARKSAQNEPSAWMIPEQPAKNAIKFPPNVARAIFTISSSGNGDEEFWYSNVLNSDKKVFGGQPLLGYSPFREIQLRIDGQLAGVAWPFPVVFTGGVVPGLWRPIVGIDAFDLKEYEIDITPFLSILCDGNPNGHEFSLNVVGIDDDGKEHGRLSDKVGSNWITTGKIFVWLDAPGVITRGGKPRIFEPPVAIDLKSQKFGALGSNTGTLGFEVKVARKFSVTTTIRTGLGIQKVRWLQSLVFSNAGILTDGSNRQVTVQETTGIDLSTNGYSRQYNYPFSTNTTYFTEPDSGNFSISANISRSIYLNQLGEGVFPSALQAFGAIPGLPNLPNIEPLSPLPPNFNPTNTGPSGILKSIPRIASAPILPLAALLNDVARGAKAGYKKNSNFGANPLRDILKSIGPAFKGDPALLQDIIKPFIPLLGQTPPGDAKSNFNPIAEPDPALDPTLDPELEPNHSRVVKTEKLMGPMTRPMKPPKDLDKFIVRPYKGYNLATTQNGTAMFFSAPSKKWSSGFGSTEQKLAFRGVRTLGFQSSWPPAGGGRISGDIDPGGYETYERHVKAINSTIVTDNEKFAGKTIGDYSNTNFTSYVSPEDVSQVDFVASSVNALLGRGPGKRKPTMVFRNTAIGPVNRVFDY